MEDKYIFETTSKREMDLVVNRFNMLLALEELKNWYRDLYNGKCYDGKYLCNGKLYTSKELMEATDVPRDEYGIIKDCEHIFSADDILERINDIIGDMLDFIERNIY